MARINLCPNPALKNDATGFFGGGARITGIPDMLRTTGYRNSNATSTLPRASGIVPGRTYRFSAYVKGTGGGSSGTANINWYANNAYLSSSPGVAYSVTSGNVTRVESGARVAPVGADQALLNITGADAQHDVTAILYEESTQLGSYFDGDSDGCSWNGTDGSSTSTNPEGDSEQPEDPPPSSSDQAGVRHGWGVPLFETDFEQASATPDPVWWSRYDGPGHNGNGTRDPERCNVVTDTTLGRKILRINGTSGGSTGGMAHELGQQYGRWEVRARTYSTGGSSGQEQYHAVLIVWPDSDDWPEDGEYDFWEVDVGDSGAGAFLHYPHDPGPVQQIHVTRAGVNPADWHNYAFEWQPTGLRGYIDGELWFGPLSGGASSTRENIQAMPSGHLTIQLDNFGGSPHRPANMDIDWVKIWDNESVAANTDITSAGGIASAEAFGAPAVGNRFRMYLTASPPDVTPSASSMWEQTSGSVQRKLDLTRGGANAAVTVAETSTNNTFDVLMGQWVSPPMTSSGLLKGAFATTVSLSESSTAADFRRVGSVYVVNNTGTVVRGVYSQWQNNNEPTTTGQAFAAIQSAAPDIPCQVGDRLVVEIGVRATNAVATSYSATLRYGGTAGDVEHLDTTGLTTNSPHITFVDAAVERLFRGRTLTATGIASSEAFGTTTVTQPPTQEITLTTGIASAEAFGTPTVESQAYPIFPDSFGGEEFGTASVSNSIVAFGIESGEVVPQPIRVLRDGDVFAEGIESAEEFGALTLVYDQWIYPDGIGSAEEFGGQEVEDPARSIVAIGIPSAQAFGTPTLRARIRPRGIPSAEAFGGKRGPAVKRGVWKLVNPTRVERWRLGDPSNVIYVRNVVALTVLLEGGVMRTVENPTTEEINAADQVWLGGRDNITESEAIRNLWVANGYDVEMSF